MYDLNAFALSDMLKASAALRQIGAGAGSMEEAAQRIVRHLYEHLTDGPGGRPACPLVRFYKTHPYGELGAELQAFAQGVLGDEAEAPETRCLTLLATAGDEAAWNDRRASVGHRAIPLPNVEAVAQFPMISQLTTQLGLRIADIVAPGPTIMVDASEATYNVFHVPEALDSPYIPAQENFVVPYAIRSVLGFGGTLPSGDLFAVILFSRVAIPRQMADLFKTVALSVKVAVLPFAEDNVFGAAEEGGR